MKRSGKGKGEGKGGAASPGLRPKKKPFQLEVGKTYETRNGKFRARIISIDGGLWDYKGEWLGREPSKRYDPRSPSWMANGHIYLRGREALDLVREARSAKRSATKGSRPKASPKSSPRNSQATPRTRRAGA